MIDPVTGLAGIQTAIGIYESIKNSKKQIPEYRITPQLNDAYSTAQQIAKYGYSGAEDAAFRQDLTRQNNSQFARAQRNFGNQLSGATMAGINYGNIGALERHFANSNSIMGQKIREAGRMAGEYQRIADMNTATKLQMYNREQAAGGNLLNAGIGNFVNTSNARMYADALKDPIAAQPTDNPATGQSTATPYNRNAAVGYNPPVPTTQAQQQFIYGTPQFPQATTNGYVNPTLQYPAASKDKFGNIYGTPQY